MDQPSLESLNVLVVDDDDVTRHAVTTILRAMGVAGLAEAPDGSQALDALQRFPADIVICDWNMAPMSGIELLRAVRASRSVPNPDIPVILLTGDTDMDRVIEARDTGATAFVAKPVTAQSLGLKVISVVQGGGRRAPLSDAVDNESAAAADYEAMKERVKGTNINEQALLATDYLNHFNEVAMLLEMVPEMPEILDRAKEWQPKSYADHFRDSNLSDKDLIIEAYEHSPARYRRPFDEAVAQLNRMVSDAIQELDKALTRGDRDEVATVASTAVSQLRQNMERANGIIHGSVPIMDQDEIDALFGG